MQAGSALTVQWVEFSTRLRPGYSASGMLTLNTVHEPDAQPVSERMEEIGNCVLDLLRTDMKSCRLLGPLFVKCLQWLASALSCQCGLAHPKDAAVAARVTSSSSAVLLQLEEAGEGSMTSLSDAMALYTAAAICENMGNEMLEEVDPFPLLGIISDIVRCHAHVSLPQADIKVSSSQAKRMGPESLTGGALTLSIAFGLMSALLAGNKPVSLCYYHVVPVL